MPGRAGLEGKPEGVEAGGILQQIRHEIQVECLPGDIPEGFEVDVSALVVGDSLHIGDLDSGGVAVLEDPDLTVCTVVPPTVMKVEEEEVEEEEVEGVEAEAEEEGEDRDKLSAEGAKIIVHNGSTVGNVAAQTSAFLKEHGLQVVEFGNAERFDYLTTIIVDYTGKEYTVQYLARLLDISEDNIQPFTGSYSEIDIRLVIGADFQLPTAP